MNGWNGCETNKTTRRRVSLGAERRGISWQNHDLRECFALLLKTLIIGFRIFPDLSPSPWRRPVYRGCTYVMFCDGRRRKQDWEGFFFFAPLLPGRSQIRTGFEEIGPPRWVKSSAGWIPLTLYVREKNACFFIWICCHWKSTRMQPVLPRQIAPSV